MCIEFPDPPRILIQNISQLEPEDCRRIEFDLFLFSKKEALRSQGLLVRLGGKQTYAIDVENVPSWRFPEQYKVRIFIDSSCMSRVRMGEIFSKIAQWLVQGKEERRNVELYIGYALSKFSPPKKIELQNKKISAVHPFFSGWTNDVKNDMELVVALGYEESKARGAIEYLDIGNPWLFIPHSPEEKFLKELCKKNEALLEASEKSHWIDYQVLQPVDAFFRLKSLVSGLLKDSNVILLPFGPKIFFALSLLLGLLERDLSVWFVDANDDEYGSSLAPSEHMVVFSCQLTIENISSESCYL